MRCRVVHDSIPQAVLDEGDVALVEKRVLEIDVRDRVMFFYYNVQHESSSRNDADQLRLT